MARTRSTIRARRLLRASPFGCGMGAISSEGRRALSPRTPEVISRYFELDADRNVDPITALFSDDPTALDECKTHHGAHQIRA
jgi:hypothetical protein